MIEVYKVPDTVNVEVLKSLEGSKGTRVNVLEDADGNDVILVSDANNPEFREIKNMLKLGMHDFQVIEYKPKQHPKSPEEK